MGHMSRCSRYGLPNRGRQGTRRQYIVCAEGGERRPGQYLALPLDLRHTRYNDVCRVAPFVDVGVTMPTADGTWRSVPTMSAMRTLQGPASMYG